MNIYISQSIREYTITLEKIFATFRTAMAAGAIIGMAGTAYLAIPNPVLGAFLFSVGLLAILSLRLPLYTGAVNFCFAHCGITPIYLFYIWVGNFIGVMLYAEVVMFTPLYKIIEPRLFDMVNTTIHYSNGQIIPASMLCGMFMYLAATTFRLSHAGPTSRSIVVILSVMGFILTGSLHSIANMFYIAASPIPVFCIRSLVVIGLMTLGNTLGSLALSMFNYKPKMLALRKEMHH